MTPPTIIFGTTALKWIWSLVDIHPLEVGFYAMVDERPNYTFFIRDVFYPKHSEANGVTCEISPEGETDLMNWLIDHERESDLEKVRFWGHSHHNMGTGPSGQDETQAIERMASTQSFVIRAICNKKREMSVSFFDFVNKIKFDHIKWKEEDDTPESYDEEKLSAINMIIADETKNINDTVNGIKEIINHDDEMPIIINKITELKEINIPTPAYMPPAYNPGYNAYNNKYNANCPKSKKGKTQSNLFDSSGGNMPGNSIIQHYHQSIKEEIEDLNSGFQRNMGYPDEDDMVIGQEAIDRTIKNWEDNQGMGG